MKTLTNVKATVTDGKLTLTADVADQAFSLPVQQVTVLHMSPHNHQWPRHVQLSGQAVFVKAFGNGVAILNEDLVAIAKAVEPRTTYPPKFRAKVGPDLTAQVHSELTPDFQWQQSSSILKDANWTAIAGATAAKLDPAGLAHKAWVRCVAHSEAGSMASNPVQIP